MMNFRVLILLAALATSACQTSSPTTSSITNNDDFQSCHALAADFRQRVATEAKTNAGYPAMTSATFLHSTRFYDQLAHNVKDDAQARELLAAMAQLGDDIRHSENKNLRSPTSNAELDEINSCSQSIAKDLAHVDTRRTLIEQLKSAPVVRDHYSTSAQWIGLLPLLKPILNWRIEILHEEEQELFSAPEDFASNNSYRSQSTSQNTNVNALIKYAYANSPLRIPQLAEADLLNLFEEFAPQLTVEAMGMQDRLGTPQIVNGRNAINTDQVTTYYLPSFTQFAGQNLLQLNYVFWFPSREPRNLIDIYAGEVDSLIWRVTFDTDGEVMLYDSIHSCGCYHKYFLASSQISERENPSTSEPANVFGVTDLNHAAGLRLLVSANEHYIVGVDNTKLSQTSNYTLAPYSSLYNLDASNMTRSFFDDAGIIDGSERLERFTLWPTGIDNVGAMRQWGTHATGFVDRQHFDDATLFDYYFRKLD